MPSKITISDKLSSKELDDDEIEEMRTVTVETTVREECECTACGKSITMQPENGREMCSCSGCNSKTPATVDQFQTVNLENLLSEILKLSQMRELLETHNDLGENKNDH